MKCLSEELIMACAEGECTAEETAEIAKHIQNCVHCKKRYEESRHEFRMFTQLAKYEPLPEPLDESFVASVREKIKDSRPTAWSERKVPSQPGGKKMKKMIAATAAGLVVLTAAGAIASPTFAEYLGFSYVKDLGRFLGISEKNVKNAFNKQGIEVTDNGITLRIEDILADTNRILVSYQLLDKNGQVIDPQYLDPIGYRRTVIEEWKKNGEPITEEKLKPLETLVFLADEKGKRMVQLSRWDQEKKKIGSYVFDHLPEDLPNQIYFKLEARQIGQVKGNWKLSIPIDLTKPKQAANVYKINKKFSSHGVEAGVQQIAYTPTMTKLTLSKNLVQSERERIEKEYPGNLMAKEFRLLETDIRYRIVDEHGRLIAQSYAPGRNANEKPKVQSLTTYGKTSGGEYVVHYQPFPETKQLTFILDSVVRYEPADFVLAFEPGQLPAKMQADGSTFVIKSFKLEKEELQKFAEIIIEERYQDQSKLADPFFIIQDETGKTYEMRRTGGIDGVRDGLERNQTLKTIEIHMDRIPEKLMIRPILAKEYKNVNFRIPIPPAHPNPR
ncbi:DUF4179 domain-containing protein [Lihuaxuella thermophila]|uniref:Anti-sigma-W factor RsiW n=1 Tax=Lihuaxuella thermophila TaxID=1173111 RepID=A0A1H8AIC6_9BACL|nr:DUF4179 domain-containing protein [Lihuaxuella thermophila]SEM70552.1 protein of unknown function [Lihuaxuella thermophila]